MKKEINEPKIFIATNKNKTHYDLSQSLQR